MAAPLIEPSAAPIDEHAARPPRRGHMIWIAPTVLNLVAGALGVYAAQGFAQFIVLFLLFMLFLPIAFVLFIISVSYLMQGNTRLGVSLTLSSVFPLLFTMIGGSYANTAWLLYAFPSCYRAAQQAEGGRYEYKWYADAGILGRPRQFRVTVVPPDPNPLRNAPPPSVIRQGYTNTSFVQKLGPCWLMEDS